MSETQTDSGWDVSAEQWETAGLTPAGKVGFKVTSATPDDSQKDKDGNVKRQAVVEITITQRPDRKVPADGEKHREYFNLNIPFVLKKFKGFAAGCGVAVKPKPGEILNIKDIIKAINGRPGFGSIEHRSYVQNGEENHQFRLFSHELLP